MFSCILTDQLDSVRLKMNIFSLIVVVIFSGACCVHFKGKFSIFCIFSKTYILLHLTVLPIDNPTWHRCRGYTDPHFETFFEPFARLCTQTGWQTMLKNRIFSVSILVSDQDWVISDVSHPFGNLRTWSLLSLIDSSRLNFSLDVVAQ